MCLVRGALISFIRRERAYFLLINFYNIRFFLNFNYTSFAFIALVLCSVSKTAFSAAQLSLGAITRASRARYTFS